MDQTSFLKHMTRLRACYPQRVADAEHWIAVVARYFEELRDRDTDGLAAALDSAWREFPEHFPGLGALADYCDRVAKRRAASSNVRRLPEVTTPWMETQMAIEVIEKVKEIK